ncbi:TolB family protein [Nonomuraea turcica]|uniref:TolB family protein n=1 Tax=Nonomuraea sp. G32 TaxID=3067274 RepID=UPI00273BD6CA|nr:hypothetical protein [Nonomuraea sp. G32]MDP4500413.1 hypothetical protein [Nonomuraea sp. G32]
MRTEDELAGALRAAATRAPEAGDLLKAVAMRKRRRQRRRTQAMAIACAAAVIGVGLATRSLFSGWAADPVIAPPSNVLPTPTRTVTVSPEALRPAPNAMAADKVWPKAVFTMPAKNADGWRYRPITSLSATKVLLSAESSFERAGKIEVYDSATRKSRVVTEVPRTPGLKDYIPQTMTTDGKTIAWFSFGRKNGMRLREIWTVPLTGGKPRLVTTLTGERAEIDAIAIDGDRIVWSEPGGVWEIPIAGGVPEQIPGGAGLHLLTWPWAGDVAAGPGTGDRNQTKMVDLSSGTALQIAVRPGTKGLRCGPSWCFGRNPKGGFVHRVDGTETRAVKGSDFGHRMSLTPILDRFVPLSSSVYDIATGKMATVGMGSSWMGIGTSSEPSTIIYWEGRPGTFRVLNLAAVPPGQ